MKKYLLSALAVLVVGLSTGAQTVISNDYGNTTVESSNNISSVSKIEEENIEERYSGMDFSYMTVEKGWGLNYNFILKGFTFGYKMMFGETNDFLRSNSAWSILLGYNYRQWLGEMFYIEGRAGIQYMHSNYEFAAGTETKTVINSYSPYNSTYTYTTTQWEEVSEGNMGLFIMPRIGVAFNNFAISAGYEWNFSEFKFDEGHTLDYFSIGIAWLM